MDVRDTRELYLDLLRGALTREAFPEKFVPVSLASAPRRAFARALASRQLVLCRRWEPADLRELRATGSDWPSEADTMVGPLRLRNVQACAERTLRERVPGDFLEAGVWRGGVTIFLRGLLEAWQDDDRAVWVADSFQGLPVPSHPADVMFDLSGHDELAVSLNEVRANFERYGLLDDRVHFLPGLFSQTMPTAPVERLALLRIDGDYYESTMPVLEALYPKLSPGGYVIVDDYFSIDPCRAAVDEYRRAHSITTPIEQVDWSAGYWRR